MRIHFISGLPRSGSTLLAAILRQNPRFRAAMSGPLFGVFEALLRGMSESNEFAMFLTEQQRKAMTRAVAEAFYEDVSSEKVIFDTSRGWCAQLPAIHELWPEARVIACVRSPAWIIDSFERRVQAAPFRRGRMFTPEAAANVYTRAESLLKTGPLGSALQGLRQAWSGEHAHQLIVVRYESLTERPAEVMARLYELLGEEPFAHDFEQVAYDEAEFDERLGMPGLHKVAPRVLPNHRETILPADLFSQQDRSFWDVPGQNPRRVIVL